MSHRCPKYKYQPELSSRTSACYHHRRLCHLAGSTINVSCLENAALSVSFQKPGKQFEKSDLRTYKNGTSTFMIFQTFPDLLSPPTMKFQDSRKHARYCILVLCNNNGRNVLLFHVCAASQCLRSSIFIFFFMIPGITAIFLSFVITALLLFGSIILIINDYFDAVGATLIVSAVMRRLAFV